MYRSAKHITSTTYHIGLAILTGGISIPITIGFSSFAQLARRCDATESGNRLEAEYVDCLVGDSENRIVQETFLGIGASLWQAATRPIAWAAISAASFIDAFGYAGKALVSIPMGLSKDGDTKIEKFWDKEERRNFTCLNTVRDFFWSAASIAPSIHSADAIRKNSLLRISDLRLAKAGLETY